jgi:hypothetical protein
MLKLPSINLKMKNLNLLEAYSIMGDALALRMTLGSNKGTKAMSSLMRPRNCVILLRVRVPWFRTDMAIFYILKTILSTRLGKFMLGNLILLLMMLLCIKMRLIALGIPLMLKCLRRK